MSTDARTAGPRIPIARPSFGPEELEAVQAPLRSGWVVQGPRVAAFEAAFGAYVGAARSLATTSCTTALHASIAALGLRPGDEVIVPAFTWVATPNVVAAMGATPVFCDVDLATFNVDVAQLETLVTPRTVGIMPVHLFGLCADMDAVNAVARRHGLWVVEDAACGFGARYRGRHAGTLGDAGCFSFHPRKSITTGEGGMVTTDRPDVADAVASIRDHGASRSDLDRHHGKAGFLLPEFDRLGFNYRMTDIQGALGVVQLGRADRILGERARCARTYDERLAGFEWLAPPVVPDGYEHGWQSYVCLFRPEAPTPAGLPALNARRNALMTTLEEHGIATRQGTHAPVLQRYYRETWGVQPEAFPNAVMADRLSLSLPLYPDLTDDEIDVVCDALREAFADAPAPAGSGG